MNRKWYFIETCFWGSDWQYVTIGSDNGQVPNIRQAIIWSNDAYVPGLSELNVFLAFINIG